MPSLPLPSTLASAIPTIQWPLSPSSCPPLHFESLDRMKEIRSSSSSSCGGGSLALNLLDTLEEIESSASNSHFGLVSLALILLGNGFTDEAHNLVTPLSWPQDTHFGHGPSIYNMVEPEAQAYASYVHCLVHRREAYNVGEFGMVGFQNANYWSNALMNSPGINSFPHDDLYKHVLNIKEQQPFRNVKEVQDWYQQHHISKEAFGKHYWEPRAVHELCALVLKNPKDDQLSGFAELVAETELRVVLGHALQRAGYDCSMDQVLKGDTPTPASVSSSKENFQTPKTDMTRGLSAANKVSSAHLQSFLTNQYVTLRNVMNVEKESQSASIIAAGIAARLLGVKACRPLEKEENAVGICIALPTTVEQAEMVHARKDTIDSSSGGPLSPGDVKAMLIKDASGVQESNDGPWHCFAPCDANDGRACFVDALYNARGETPTTVVQWSKGTIF